MGGGLWWVTMGYDGTMGNSKSGRFKVGFG